MEKGVKNLEFLTTLVPRRYMTATYLTLRQLALNNSRLPLFPTLNQFADYWLALFILRLSYMPNSPKVNNTVFSNILYYCFSFYYNFNNKYITKPYR